jgi:hypothetical protein
MWIALALVALIIVAAVIVVIFRRPEGDDIDSVRSYHTALGTLEHLSDRTGRSSVSIVERGERPGVEGQVPRSYQRSTGAAGVARTVTAASPGGGTGGSVPPVPVRGNDEFPDPETPLIFDDSRPHDRVRHDGSGQSLPVSRADRAQRHALDSMNHRPRRATTIMIVVAALVLFGVLAYAGSKRSDSGHSHAASASASATSSTAGHASRQGSATTGPGTTSGSGAHKTSTSTTTGAGGSTKAKAKAKAAKAKDKATKPTPTTQPSQVTALTSTSSSATYPVTDSNYQLTVTGTGSCWVAVTSSTTGSTLWAGEVAAGAVQVVPASGTVTVQLGTPEVTLAVDKVPVVLPTPVSAPFVATFQPTAAALAASPPTTTTTTTSGSGSATSSTTPP